MFLIMRIFKDKIAFITGGASGIGRALCENLARYGATVTVADINLEGAQQVAESITSSGGRAEAVKLDVTNKDDVERLIDETVKKHGRLDYMFNNAGIGIIGDERDKGFDTWKKIIDTNLMSVIYGTLAAYSIMTRQGSGHIVNTASIAGFMPAPVEVAYGTTKHAVVGLSTSLRTEGAALGVKVSAICPGVMETAFFKTAPFINANRDAFLSIFSLIIMKNIDRAARIALRGVARNRAIIVFPIHARLAWWFTRIHPSIMVLVGRFNIRRFRKISRNADSGNSALY
jgi:NAD(P)-dependent dehydrogenase (short-subunit alcohol dehydrogenase family)